MQNYKLLVSYDGKNFFGWQKTKEKRTIEGTLQSVLEIILQQKIRLQAASRTDRGVHAKAQVVNFFSSKVFDPGKILYSANQLLPPEIRAFSLEKVEDCFHPSFAAGKTYLYQIYTGRVPYPHERLYYWHFPKIFVQDLQEVFPLFLGKRDFSAFSTEKAKNPICHMYSLSLEKMEERWYFRLQADRFLYKMARTLVGTLMYYAAGKLHKEDLERLFLHKLRKQAGVLAPSHGLFLEKIHYNRKELYDKSQ